MENLIELKKIANEMYQLYILLINFIEKNDKKNIFELSKKINEYKSKEEEILATLDEKTILFSKGFLLSLFDNAKV